MAERTDWLPGSRNGVLVMAKEQISYTTSERRTAWRSPRTGSWTTEPPSARRRRR
jgi:hypothetical protein